MFRYIAVFFSFLLFLNYLSFCYDPSLLAYWSFDEGNTRDVSGNGYDGIMVNNPTFVQGVSGKAIHFQGKGYYIPTNGGDERKIGSHVLLPPIDLHQLDEFSITMWVKHEGFSNYYGDAYLWFGHYQKGYLCIQNHVFEIRNDFNLYYQFTVAGLNFSNTIEMPFDEKYKNVWVCLGMVYRKNWLYAYVNGILIDSMMMKVNYELSYFALARSWWNFGGEERNSARFTGAIDEVKIWKKALTEEEIRAECSNCGPMSFEYADFHSSPNLNLIGSARFDGNTIVLTPSLSNQAGAVWTSTKVPLGNGFETEFKFRMRDGINTMHKEEHYQGADGIAFVIQNYSNKTVGLTGGGIGYSGFPRCLAIEIDTYANDSLQIENYNDPNDNHIAVLSGGLGEIKSEHRSPYLIAENKGIMPLRVDGTIYFVKIQYSENELKVWIDTSERYGEPVIDVKDVDIVNMLGLDGEGWGYIGITSATGNAYERHELLAWKFCTFSMNFVSDVEEKSYKFLKNNIKSNNSKVIIEGIRESFSGVKIYDILGNTISLDDLNYTFDGTNLNLDFDKLGCGFYFILIRYDNREELYYLLKSENNIVISN
ncbi:hypothetical protein D9V87_02275 [Bacteroidetes/Chlorobi group bacterium MS-B_bin-24]|nr:MAG: hypothetical protein D9V87_02275 [Bacteroidetes/Chlorobi group bacterium MS-B_bin-24]